MPIRPLSLLAWIPFRIFAAFFLVAAPAALLAAENEPLVWTDIEQLEIRGKGWEDTRSPFDRLPARAEESVRPPVWALSRDSAGLYVDFVADTSTVAVRWSLTRDRLQMHHMPSTGVSGVDLYVWDDTEDRWRWLANGRPAAQTDTERTLVRNIPAAERKFRLYLPLYNGVTSLAIGAENEIREAGGPERKPLVFYGTSITQGASAMRPGMAYPALLGRWLGFETINLGFSGNGRLEPEVAHLVAELDPAVFVLDPLPNVSGPSVTPLLTDFLAILREKHPETPIVLVESIVYTNGFLVPSRHNRHTDSSRQMREVFATLSAADPNLHLVAAEALLGEDGEDTVDGTHPTDLGFYRIAKGIEAKLKDVLGNSAKPDPTF